MITKPFVLLLLVIILFSCGSKDNPEPASPTKAVLVFPAQNAVCTTGTIISIAQSSVILSWLASQNTDSYDITITNLLTGNSTTQNTTATQLPVTLNRNTPYSWSVSSKSTRAATMTKSDTWKFYNSGAGIITYPPFPAQIITPFLGQNILLITGSTQLSWTGSDVDNDIKGYDVYLGAATTPPLFKSDISDSFLNVTVSSGITYYWRVVTKDVQGNTSDSGIYQFKVN